MSQPRATGRAFWAGALAGLAVVLVAAAGVVLVRRGGDGGAPKPESAPAQVEGATILAVPRGGHVLVALPPGWSVRETAVRTPGSLHLASPRTCHTAVVTALVDRSGEPPEQRGPHLLGYMTGREFDPQRLWRGTTADGRGYAIYDPAALIGVEVVRARSRSTTVVVHGLPTHERCSAHDAAAPRWELSRLLQDLRVRDGSP